MKQDSNAIRPLISVIMAVYNGMPEMDEAVSSVLRQSYKEIELLICDDASTDDTWKRLQTFAAQDARIRLSRNEKRSGAGHARNVCLAQANGTYIALMDADDISLPSRIEKQAECLDAIPDIAFVGTKGEFFRDKPGDRREFYPFYKQPDRQDFLMTLPFVHASMMFRADVLHKIGGYRENRMVLRSEDYDMLLRAYAMGFRGINLSEPLYAIRVNPETYRRRKYRYRVYESLVKWTGFSKLGLMPRGIPYAVKPLIVGLIPARLLTEMKRAHYGRMGE